jgi:hypothetical protein
MEIKTYTIHDLKPESINKPFEQVKRKDLVKEKFKYCYTLRYKGTKICFTNGIETKELI